MPEQPQMISSGIGESWKLGLPIVTPTQLTSQLKSAPTYLSTYRMPSSESTASHSPSPVTLTTLWAECHQRYLPLGKLRI